MTSWRWSRPWPARSSNGANDPEVHGRVQQRHAGLRHTQDQCDGTGERRPTFLSDIEPLMEDGNDQKRSIDLDWLLQVRSLAQDGPLVRRREVVHCELRKEKKHWKIVSLKPLDFFAPAKLAHMMRRAGLLVAVLPSNAGRAACPHAVAGKDFEWGREASRSAAMTHRHHRLASEPRLRSRFARLLERIRRPQMARPSPRSLIQCEHAGRAGPAARRRRELPARDHAAAGAVCLRRIRWASCTVSKRFAAHCLHATRSRSCQLSTSKTIRASRGAACISTSRATGCPSKWSSAILTAWPR